MDEPVLLDPVAYGRTRDHPLPEPILGHSDYQADPGFSHCRTGLLDRLPPAVPRQRGAGEPPEPSGKGASGPGTCGPGTCGPGAPEGEAPGREGTGQGNSGRSSG